MSSNYRIINTGYNFVVVSPEGEIVERCHNRATARLFKNKYDTEAMHAKLDAFVERISGWEFVNRNSRGTGIYRQ